MRVPVGAERLSPFCVVERTINAFSNMLMLLMRTIFLVVIGYHGSIFARIVEISSLWVSTIWGDGSLQEAGVVSVPSSDKVAGSLDNLPRSKAVAIRSPSALRQMGVSHTA
jgi:hypothetical protein